ncbi:unnamed protein product [Phytomonas sp. Hart1]|nr:unnamed protein product [Phytomonas sp. Hart1]|eukprot:CCW68454.1 unnamed protein product [Phytomonas sp. isolate Hart1]
MNRNGNAKNASLVSRLEDSIIRFFYGPKAAKAALLTYKLGLQSPLWLWTHHTSEGDNRNAMCNRKEMQKLCNLIEWFLHNNVDVTKVAVIVPLELKAVVKRELLTAAKGRSEGEVPLPVVLAHHELGAINRRDHITYKYQAVLYVLGLPPSLDLLPRAISQENFIGDALEAAENGFVLFMDAGWKASVFKTKWPQWKNVLEKLQDEQPLISMSETLPLREDPKARRRLPTLVGPSLPLCCAQHPNQRQIEYGLIPIVPACRRFCFHQYNCGKPGHVCREACHPAMRHDACPFACLSTMACEHGCLRSCAEPCACFQIIERPLTCSHSIVLGLEKESLEPIYGVVHHVFKGICGDSELPCEVEYTTECSRCLGPMPVRCFEAQQHRHTPDHRTMVCGLCRRLERELRAQLLGTVLLDTEAEKGRVKMEMQRSLYQQRKAAAQGLFWAGAKVEIIDPTKCMPPLFAEEDFPGIEFVDMNDPNFYEKMGGAYGTFVSNHVDVMDRGELRNLVRLPDGLHVLVTDGGLRMIRALADSVKTSKTLLLTNNGASSSIPDTAAVDAGGSVDFAAAKTMIGELYYLSQPVPCPAWEPSGILSDKVVRVVGIDPSSSAHVMAECSIIKLLPGNTISPSRIGEAASTNPIPSHDTESEPPLKRTRIGSEGATSPSHSCQIHCDYPFTSSNYRHEAIVLEVRVPLSSLDSLKGYQSGRYVFVVNPERQITNPHEVEMMEAAIQRSKFLGMANAAVCGARVQTDTPYKLLGIVNPPLNLAELNIGPCALLQPRSDSLIAAPPSAVQRRMGSGHANRGGAVMPHPQQLPPPRAGDLPLVLIPFMFTLPDELTEAENALDAAAMKRFEQRLEEALALKCEELSLRHDEEAFHAQQQMPEVSAQVLAAYRQTFSIPAPLPTPEQVAEAKRRYTKLPRASLASTRIIQAKDILASKQEEEQTSQWVEGMSDLFEKDFAADSLYIRRIQMNLKLY